jgi:hypothetical protein
VSEFAKTMIFPAKPAPRACSTTPKPSSRGMRVSVTINWKYPGSSSTRETAANPSVATST